MIPGYVLIALTSIFIQLIFLARIYSNLRLANIMKPILLHFIVVFFYLIADMLLMITPSPEKSMLVLKFQTIFWINASNSFWYVICKITEQKTPPLLKWSVINAIIFTLASLSSTSIVGGVALQPWGYVFVAGPLFLATVSLTFVFPCSAALYILIKEIRNKNNSDSAKQKSKLIFSGTIITFLAIILSDVILPHVLGFTSFYRIGANSTTIHLFFMLIATKTHISSKIKLHNAWHYIFHNLDEGIILLENKRITYCNNFARTNLKKTYDKIIGESIDNINIPFKKLDTYTTDNEEASILLLKPRKHSS
jgi:hypothetical protein